AVPDRQPEEADDVLGHLVHFAEIDRAVREVAGHDPLQRLVPGAVTGGLLLDLGAGDAAADAGIDGAGMALHDADARALMRAARRIPFRAPRLGQAVLGRVLPFRVHAVAVSLI